MPAHTPYRCYTALGVPEDSSDDLVVFAYRKQVETDAGRAPWYLSYLRQAANMRSSDILLTEIALATSQGSFDAEQLQDAYRYFGLSFESPPHDDDYIIGLFTSRLDDARRHEREMRENLKIIGVHRSSQKIIAVAEECKKHLNTAR